MKRKKSGGVGLEELERVSKTSLACNQLCSFFAVKKLSETRCQSRFELSLDLDQEEVRAVASSQTASLRSGTSSASP